MSNTDKSISHDSFLDAIASLSTINDFMLDVQNRFIELMCEHHDVDKEKLQIAVQSMNKKIN